MSLKLKEAYLLCGRRSSRLLYFAFRLISTACLWWWGYGFLERHNVSGTIIFYLALDYDKALRKKIAASLNRDFACSEIGYDRCLMSRRK